ncbi:hypothetical protein D3C78_1441070 [compost metagenome]
MAVQWQGMRVPMGMLTDRRWAAKARYRYRLSVCSRMVRWQDSEVRSRRALRCGRARSTRSRLAR